MAKRNTNKNQPEAAFVIMTTTTTGGQAASARAILAIVSRISTAAKKLQNMIHDCAVLAMIHAETYRDAEPMKRLYMALPNGQRREALVDWVHANSPIVIRDKGNRVGITPADEKGYVPFDIEAAKASPYYEKSERAMKPLGEYDPVKALEQKIKTTRKAIEDAAKPENANVVFFKDDFDAKASLATWERQLAALKAA